MAACKVGLRLASGKANFRRDQPHHSQNQEEWLKLLVQTLWFTLNTHFASGSLEQCYMAGRGYLWNLHPVNTLGTECPVSFPVWPQFTLLGEIRTLRGTPLGEDSRRRVPGSPQTSSHVPLSPAVSFHRNKSQP